MGGRPKGAIQNRPISRALALPVNRAVLPGGVIEAREVLHCRRIVICGIPFLAYCLQVTIKARLRNLAPGLTPYAVLEKMTSIQMLDVHLPTTDGRELLLPRCTSPPLRSSCFITNSNCLCRPAAPSYLFLLNNLSVVQTFTSSTEETPLQNSSSCESPVS